VIAGDHDPVLDQPQTSGSIATERYGRSHLAEWIEALRPAVTAITRRSPGSGAQAAVYRSASPHAPADREPPQRLRVLEKAIAEPKSASECFSTLFNATRRRAEYGLALSKRWRILAS